MHPFIESIMLRDGELQLMKYHQERFERTRREVLGLKKHPVLEEHIPVPESLQSGTYKCRLRYGTTLGEAEFQVYEARRISSLKLLEDDSIDYKYKSSDRRRLEKLYGKRRDCDDILIVKNGRISDSFAANVVFRKGQSWFTPDSPLLAGCQRARLLEEGRIAEVAISLEELHRFEGFQLINALNTLEEGPELPMEAIRT